MSIEGAQTEISDLVGVQLPAPKPKGMVETKLESARKSGHGKED